MDTLMGNIMEMNLENDLIITKTSLICNNEHTKQSIKITMRLGGAKKTSKQQRHKFESQYMSGSIF